MCKGQFILLTCFFWRFVEVDSNTVDFYGLFDLYQLYHIIFVQFVQHSMTALKGITGLFLKIVLHWIIFRSHFVSLTGSCVFPLFWGSNLLLDCCLFMVFRLLAPMGCVDDGGGCGRNTGTLASYLQIHHSAGSCFVCVLAALQLSNSRVLLYVFVWHCVFLVGWLLTSLGTFWIRAQKAGS